MAWYWIVLIVYFGLNLILAILAMWIGFGMAGTKELAWLFIKALFFGLPILIFYAIGGSIVDMR